MFIIFDLDSHKRVSQFATTKKFRGEEWTKNLSLKWNEGGWGSSCENSSVRKKHLRYSQSATQPSLECKFPQPSFTLLNKFDSNRWNIGDNYPYSGEISGNWSQLKVRKFATLISFEEMEFHWNQTNFTPVMLLVIPLYSISKTLSALMQLDILLKPE